jgi:rubrerythrin
MPRLIDADELYVDARCGENEEPYISLYQINNAPTVDIDAITESHEKIGYDKGFRDGYAQATSEVRHGHWNERYDTQYHFECSICKYLHQYKDNYCPLCGAKMDGERREDAEKTD